jgi:hypothetical protein
LRDGSIARVAVVVVLVAIQAVVGVVAESLICDTGKRAGSSQAVANVVIVVSDVAVFAVLDRAGDRFGLEPAEIVVGIPNGPLVEFLDPGALAGAGGMILPAVNESPICPTFARSEYVIGDCMPSARVNSLRVQTSRQLEIRRPSLPF